MTDNSPDITAKALRLITDCGLRPSPQRLAVAAYVLAHRTHPTADEIYSAIKVGYPSLSRTTVYNTLRALVESNAICELTIEPGNSRFDGYTEPHAHFRCDSCKRIYDIIMPQLPELTSFDVKKTQLYFSGQCPSCKRAAAGI